MPAVPNIQSPSTPAGSPSNEDVNYISDGEDNPGPLSNGYESSDGEDQDEDDWNISDINVAPLPHVRRIKRVLEQLRANEKDGLHRIAALAAKETALPPGILMQNAKYLRGYAAANKNLQIDQWAYKEHFAAAIIDEATGEAMEYRHLMEKPDLRAL